jgi:beta-galactosidase
MNVRLTQTIRFAALALMVMRMSLCCATNNAQTVSQPHPPLWLGVSWYPEQWPESQWDADLTLMQKGGVRFVRMGEFAWSTMEPAEGEYRWDWLDHAIAAAASHNIYVVLGTPTAAPPAWLTEKYPSVLRLNADGTLEQHGNRQQFSFASPKYRELSAGIAAEMGKRYGHNPAVIGWQIDNELTTESYDPVAKKDFQQWLEARYKTLDALNYRWMTAYWSQTYSKWSQIPLEAGKGNPGLLLNWRRFDTDMWVSYAKNEIEALRPYTDPRQFMTTNVLGWGQQTYDHRAVAQIMDFISYDDYFPQGEVDLARNGADDDMQRGFKDRNFWVMETQPGFVNWGGVNQTLAKGEVRAVAWHNVGHGADAIAYWQWRSARNGQEEYHGTLVGANGKPVPVYDEVAELGAEFAKAGPALDGTTPRSEVALLHTYDSFWAINLQRHNKDYDPVDELVSYYRPLKELAQSIDIVTPTSDLSRYKLVVAPGLNVLSDAAGQSLIAYVRAGGNLVLGQRTAMKDEDNALQPQDQPGPLADLLGAHVKQFYALMNPVAVQGSFGTTESKLWAEQLAVDAPDTEVWSRYGKSNGWLDGQPAIVSRKVGKGTITYVGVWMPEAAMKALAQKLVTMSGVRAPFGPVPSGVEVNPRVAADHTVFVLVNMSGAACEVHPAHAMTDVLHGGSVSVVTLAKYGVAVLSDKK